MDSFIPSTYREWRDFFFVGAVVLLHDTTLPWWLDLLSTVGVLAVVFVTAALAAAAQGYLQKRWADA